MSERACHFLVCHRRAPIGLVGAERGVWVQAYAVLSVLATLADEHGRVTISQAWIAGHLGVSRKRVNELVAVLVHQQAVEFDPKTMTYTVIGVCDGV